MAETKKRKTRKKRRIGKISKPKRKKSVLGKIVKFQALLTGIFLVSYLAIGFRLGPGTLQRDIQGKVAGATTLLSAHFIGPPEKTVVTAQSLNDGISNYVRLDWLATNDTDNYDIYKNGGPLITGVTDTFFNDYAVTVGNTYKYYVVANGPLGTSQSDEVETTVEDHYVPPPPPPPSNLSCTIRTLGKIDLQNYRCLPITNKKRPVITGTASLASARVNAEIRSASGKRSVLSTFSANGNGYWAWGVQGKLKKGVKYLYVTVIDPSDASRFGSCSLKFKVAKKMPSRKKMRKCTKANLQAQSIANFFVPSSPLSLSLENKDEFISAGDDLKLRIADSSLGSSGSLQYQLQDEQNREILASSESMLGKANSFEKYINLPGALQAGRYRLSVEYEKNGEMKSAVSSFRVKEKPFLILGEKTSYTYAEFLSHLGWVVFASLLLLAVFGILLLFEYHLAGNLAVEISEDKLKREGYID